MIYHLLLLFLATVEVMNPKMALCFLFTHSATARIDENLCPGSVNCTCIEDNGDGKIKVNCSGIQRIESLRDVLEEIGFRPISQLTVTKCSANSLPDSVFTNSSIDYLYLRCSFRRLADHSLSAVSSLTSLSIKYSKFQRIPQAIRKLQNLRSLTTNTGRLTAIGDELRNMTYLSFLSFRKNMIETVSKDAFIYNTNLRDINLERNRIKAFHAGTFKFCQSIKVFSVAYNKLQFFRGIINSQSLTEINLRGNGLRSVQKVFRGMDKITFINLGENALLRSLSDKTFSGDPHFLKTLLMDRCKLVTLPPNFIKPLTRLEEVDFSFNLLRSIPDKFFHKMIDLKIVNLSGNRLVTLHNTFKANTYLEVVNLRANCVEDIGNAFQSVSFLKKVDLEDNNIKAITREDFKNCIGMQYLKLNKNHVSRIDTDAFDDLKQLKFLHLNHNNILTLNGSVQGLQDLEVLSLKTNYLEMIDAREMFSLNHLKDLNLQDNKLRNVNFSYLVSLSSLNLRKNALKILPRSSFPLNIPLEDLQVASNKWICDCRLSWLRELCLSKNITNSKRLVRCSKPYRFQGLNITDLSAEQLIQWPEYCPPTCKCTCIPENEFFFVKVDCSDRGLSEVPSMLPKETGQLFLQDNVITNLTGFKSDELTDLKLINLERNHLKKLDFAPPESVKVLKLSGNNLTRFFESPPKNVSQWTLSNNPWICDCETEAFRKWMLSNTKQIQDINSTRCVENNDREYLNNKVIVRLSEIDLCPSLISTYIIIAVCILIALLSGTSSRIVYSRYHYHIKVWLYSHGVTWLKKKDNDDGKGHDAFISAADQDLHLVRYILTELENKDPHYTLFEPRRDMRAGEMFEFEKEMEEVTNSKRIIILLSENYINNNFLMEIFKFAFATSLEENSYRLILIIVGILPSLPEMDQSLKAAIESTRCLRFEQKLFWEMLRYAMPKKQHKIKEPHECKKEEWDDVAILK